MQGTTRYSARFTNQSSWIGSDSFTCRGIGQQKVEVYLMQKDIFNSLHYSTKRHMRTRRKRRALPITDTELKLIAAAASMGLSRIPKNGYNTPAAIGTPIEL